MINFAAAAAAGPAIKMFAPKRSAKKFVACGTDFKVSSMLQILTYLSALAMIATSNALMASYVILLLQGALHDEVDPSQLPKRLFGTLPDGKQWSVVDGKGKK